MLNNVKYVICKDYDYTLNYELLYNLYSPIIGAQATDLYIKLNIESNKNQKMSGISMFLDDFQKFCNLSPVKFAEFRAKLEAVGLLQTYLDDSNKNTDMIYYFVIKQPLSFFKFIDNQQYRQLLINAIGELNYEKLEFMYLPSKVPATATNVSSTFEMVFNDKEINNIKTFNFNKLYENIAKNTSTIVSFSEAAKNHIERYHTNYNISESEIEHIAYGCIVQKDNSFEVDADLLSMKLHEYVISSKNVSAFSNIKLHRNAAMFIKNFDSNDLETIFDEYKNLNSEQYLAAIYKAPLNAEEIETINIVRKSYKLCDYIINLLIDFTLFKTNGKLNRTYITKIAKTINGLNLVKLSEIYNYFRFNNQDINQLNNPKKDEQPQLTIDWDNI